MAGEHTHTDAHKRRFTPGWITLAGMLSGALIGWLAEPSGAVPLGMAAGVALGAGMDSLLNRRINGPFDTGDDSANGSDT